MPVGDPIPPRPAAFTPDGAPPGVAVDLEALKGLEGKPWYLGRPKITPRLTLVHTNGASVEASLQSSIGYGNRGPSNTKPHYHVARPQPTKVVPTDRRAIANATVDAYQGEHGDVSMWSIAIETADAGWPNPGDAGGFLVDHAEIVARILAYESIVWAIPLEYPDAWHGAGTACHTEPFTYPYWTLYRGKACPGTEKKRQMREEILPRAREIRAAWLAPDVPPPTQEVPDMILVRNAEPHQFTDGKTYPARNVVWELVHGELRHVSADEYAALTGIPFTGEYTNAQLDKLPRYSRALSGTLTGKISGTVQVS